MAKRRIIPLFIPHVGCPNQCVFCDQNKISGAAAPVTPEIVRKEIEASLPAAGEGCELAFYGGSFTAIPAVQQDVLLSAAQPYMESGAIAAIRLSTRPDGVDDGICCLLKRYGVTTVELGCQSLDDRVLALTRRGHNASDTERAVSCLRRHGFSVILQMMTGLPGDTGKESVETARKIIDLKPDGVRIYPTVVVRGTELEQMMYSGVYLPHRVEDAVSICAELYEMFLAADIPVIRVGLNPTELLSSGEALAGAYHPALGELVLSELYLRRTVNLLRDIPGGSSVTLQVHPSRVSVMVGQHRQNILFLKTQYGLSSLKVVPEAKELWEISLKKT